MLDDVLRLIFPFPCKIIAYADDLTVITSHRDPMQATLNLQKACDIIGLWLKGVKLSLNAIKSVFVIFHRFRAPLPPLSLVIDGVTILTSQSVTFLGFLLDAQLKWSRHITEKCIAAKKAIFAVNSCLRKSWGFDSVFFSCTYLSLSRFFCTVLEFGLVRSAHRKQSKVYGPSNGQLLSLQLELSRRRPRTLFSCSLVCCQLTCVLWKLLQLAIRARHTRIVFLRPLADK